MFLAGGSLQLDVEVVESVPSQVEGPFASASQAYDDKLTVEMMPLRLSGKYFGISCGAQRPSAAYRVSGRLASSEQAVSAAVGPDH